MNPIECQACGTSAPADAHHCENCGSADWRPSLVSVAPDAVDASTNSQPFPDSAPVASETPTRPRRNR